MPQEKIQGITPYPASVSTMADGSVYTPPWMNPASFALSEATNVSKNGVLKGLNQTNLCQVTALK